MMIIGACACFPQIRHAVGFFKRLGRNPPDLVEGNEPNPSLGYSSPPAPILRQTIVPSSDRSVEGPRRLVDSAATNHSSPIRPVITTSDHSYGTIKSSERHPSSTSPGLLVPPSPARSISETSESVFDSIISANNSTRSGASSFSNEAIANGPLFDTSSWLEDSLSDVRCEWPKGSGHYFLSADDIQSLLSINSIEEEIQCRNIPVLLGQSRRQLAIRILNSAPKLFCILILLRQAQCISGFLDEDVDDSELPFTRDDKSRPSGNFRLCSQSRPNQPINCMSDWTSKLFRDFSREQWSVIIPVFKESESIEHYKFDDNCIFPFTRDEERNHFKEGGFGRVWEVDIHPAHHSFHSKVLRPSFALKRLHSRRKDLFDSEVAMLKEFSKRRQHDHLVKLLATYEFKGEFYLLFPWAKASLQDYWEQTPDPEFTEFTVKWILRQFKGIASGLQRIHGYQTTFDAKEDLKNIQSAIHDADTISTDPIEHMYKYSRHGDIKPENILWSDEDTPDDNPHFNEQGILLIADFGLMTSHRNSTFLGRTPEQIRGSAPYEPPEVTEPKKSAVSRAHDIWSLGCVYLEFVTWLVCNLKDLERFRLLRSNSFDDERFFVLIDNGRSPRTAVVKPVVRRWIEELHKKSLCSEFVHELLDLIADRMLVIDPKDRIHCGPLNEALTEMVKKADENSNYLVRGDPSRVRRRATKTTIPDPNDDQPLPNPKDGSPLPKRPSVENKLYAHALRRARTEPVSEWRITSQPSSPTIVADEW